MRSILFVVALLFAYSASAKQTLNMVVGFHKPPYVFEKQNRGYELELLQAAANELDYDLEFIFVPFGRSAKMFDKTDVDGILTVNPSLIKDTEKLTIPYITYRNVAISFNAKQLAINTVTDLKHHTIAAFQNSQKILGTDYAQATTNARYFTEVPDQGRQVQLLLNGKVNVLVMDINIFKHFLKVLSSRSLTEFKIHRIFPPTDYSLALRNAAQREAFNQIFRELKSKPFYADLQAKYDVSEQKLASN